MAIPLKICIKAISLSCVSICEDTILWDSSSNGAFDPKNAYSIAAGNVHQPNLFKGKWIWSLDILPKIKTSILKCYISCLPIKVMLVNRGR